MHRNSNTTEKNVAHGKAKCLQTIHVADHKTLLHFIKLLHSLHFIKLEMNHVKYFSSGLQLLAEQTHLHLDFFVLEEAQQRFSLDMV